MTEDRLQNEINAAARQTTKGLLWLIIICGALFSMTIMALSVWSFVAKITEHPVFDEVSARQATYSALYKELR